ncbi:MAG TPA: hypothetical protein VK761_00555 [Solirubrobacteraceae bacterium]|nr:hypothetical protein [Solirubrobacteraceae bacterium]
MIAEPGSGGSVLVVDRDAIAPANGLLVAHLAPDEPASNADLVVDSYLERLHADRYRCRPIADEDFLTLPFVEEDRDAIARQDDTDVSSCSSCVLEDRLGWRYRLERLNTGMSIPELRWCRIASAAAARAERPDEGEPVSLREAIGALQAYEPICGATHAVVRRGRNDDSVSTAMLRAELARVRESPIVLNRALRDTVLAMIEHDALSLSEIAMRCGRTKRDTAGNVSGETSWLARRLGMMPEGGRATPTPWVHVEVLALIARDGLGLSPREVEAS